MTKITIKAQVKGDVQQVWNAYTNPENQNPIEMQQAGWQAILDNFNAMQRD